MAKDVIMPALGMAQETGILLQWLKAPGQTVTKGEPLMEIETDKATVEIEAPASGILSQVTAQPGDVIPVGQRIASILAPGEAVPVVGAVVPTTTVARAEVAPAPVTATPIAARMAAERGLELARIKPQGGKVQKEDVLAYLAAQNLPSLKNLTGLKLASPKARRLAQERGLDLHTLTGSGPEGAVLAHDVETFRRNVSVPQEETFQRGVSSNEAETPHRGVSTEILPLSRTWRVMAERLAQAWATIPHFYLMREVNAARLITWRESAQKWSAEKITFTDLLVRLVAVALRQHPRLNASWQKDSIRLNADINIGLAVAIEDGLVVPVIPHAEQLKLEQLAARRKELVARAQAGKLTLADLSDGTFTISNLGMYGVDAFNAIVNPPQAAILAVSRIADRVVPLNGQPAVQPMLTLSLSCDHRLVDGARGAQFLQTLAELVEEPMKLLD